MPYQEARPRNTVVVEPGADATLVVPGAIGRAVASVKVSRKNRQLERTGTVRRRSKIMRFADGERNKHSPTRPRDAKKQHPSTRQMRSKIVLFIENLHLINLSVRWKSSREATSNYILRNEARTIARLQKLDYATGIKFGHWSTNYLWSLIA